LIKGYTSESENQYFEFDTLTFDIDDIKIKKMIIQKGSEKITISIDEIFEALLLIKKILKTF